MDITADSILPLLLLAHSLFFPFALLDLACTEINAKVDVRARIGGIALRSRPAIFIAHHSVGISRGVKGCTASRRSGFSTSIIIDIFDCLCTLLDSLELFLDLIDALWLPCHKARADTEGVIALVDVHRVELGLHLLLLVHHRLSGVHCRLVEKG